MHSENADARAGAAATEPRPSRAEGAARGSVTATERLLAPDLGRGFMLLIIALAHASLWLSTRDATLSGRPIGGSAADQALNFVSTLLVDSRGMPLFGILLGYGLTMMVDRQRSAGTSERESRRLLRRRAVGLLLLGFVHSVLIGGIDILAEYGLYTLLVGWLLFRGDRALRRTIVLLTLIYLVVLSAFWIGMAHVGASPVAAIHTGTTSYVESTIISLINFPFMIVGGLVAYPMILPVLIGMWVARKGLLEGGVPGLPRIALIGTAVSVLGGLPLALQATPAWDASPTTEGLSAVLHMMTGIAAGVGYAAVLGWIGQRIRRIGPVVGAMVALGRRSLTFYLFIELMLVIVLSPVALGYGQVLHSTGAAAVAALVWLLSLLLASAMERRGVRGPADALLRRFVYRT